TNQKKNPNWKAVPDNAAYCFGYSQPGGFRSGVHIALRVNQKNRSRWGGVHCTPPYVFDVQKYRKLYNPMDVLRVIRHQMDKETYLEHSIWDGLDHCQLYKPDIPPSIFSISIRWLQNQTAS